MRSTRRAEDIAGVVGLGVMLGLGALAWQALPPVPTAPAYVGAGNATPQRGGTLVVHHEDDARSYDPAVAYDEISSMGLKLMNETLLDYTHALELEPRLAESMPVQSEDGRTFTFTLREGIRFHNGRRLEAEDIRYSMERMLAPSTSSPGAVFYSALDGYADFQAGRAAHVRGIQVLDARTIRFVLSEPQQTFLNALALNFAAPVPREEVERLGLQFARHPVGVGAFRFESWEPGLRATFVRNEDFFIAGQPYLDRIVIELNLNRGPAFLRLQAGDLDHMHRFAPTDNLWLHRQEAWQPTLVDTPNLDMWGVGMNTEIAPFDELHVRRAVAFAINRAAWRRARANRLLVLGQPIPANMPGHFEDLEGDQHYDLDAAREEMRIGGHPVERVDGRFVARGLEAPIEVWVGAGDTGRAYGELIQNDLAAIGLTIEIRQVAFPVYLTETGRRHTVGLFLTGWSADYPDPSNFLDTLFHSRSIHESASENRTFYSNPEVDALLDRARVEADREARMALYRQAEEIIVHDAPWAFAFSNLVTDVWQPYVHGYDVHPVWRPLYRDVWLDLPRRENAP